MSASLSCHRFSFTHRCTLFSVLASLTVETPDLSLRARLRNPLEERPEGTDHSTVRDQRVQRVEHQAGLWQSSYSQLRWSYSGRSNCLSAASYLFETGQRFNNRIWIWIWGWGLYLWLTVWQRSWRFSYWWLSAVKNKLKNCHLVGQTLICHCFYQIMKQALLLQPFAEVVVWSQFQPLTPHYSSKSNKPSPVHQCSCGCCTDMCGSALTLTSVWVWACSRCCRCRPVRGRCHSGCKPPGCRTEGPGLPQPPDSDPPGLCPEPAAHNLINLEFTQ